METIRVLPYFIDIEHHICRDFYQHDVNTLFNTFGIKLIIKMSKRRKKTKLEA